MSSTSYVVSATSSLADHPVIFTLIGARCSPYPGIAELRSTRESEDDRIVEGWSQPPQFEFSSLNFGSEVTKIGVDAPIIYMSLPHTSIRFEKNSA